MSRLKRDGKYTKIPKAVPDHEDEPSNCIICLERVSCRGKLSVCNHWFCFPCILEWAENTNTCPICKARFRCITKVHVSPFKSPPIKVRVGDKDQRVWNDDDEVVADDVLAAVESSDDLDDDYEPPIHVDNPWTRSLQNRRRQQGSNTRRGLSQTSRQLQFDQYDLEDSFIDDTDEALQAYLFSTYNRDTLNIIDDDDDGGESDSEGSTSENVPRRVSPYPLRNSCTTSTRTSRNTTNSVERDTSNVVDDDEDAEEEEEEEEEEELSDAGEIVGHRASRYTLRNSHSTCTRSTRNTVSSVESLPQVIGEQPCASPASIDSFIADLDSFIVSDDESADELNSDWVPFGNHSKNSRNKSRSQVKTKKQDTKRSSASERSGPSTRKSQQSHKPEKQQKPHQRRNNKTRKKQHTSISDEEFQEPRSSRNRDTNNPSANGWISMTEKRAKAHTSSSTVSACPRTRQRGSIKEQKKDAKSIDHNSSSDSDVEVLRDLSNNQEHPHDSRTSYTIKDTGNKPTNSRLRQNQQHSLLASISACAERHEDTPSDSSGAEDNFSDAIIQPTPCSKTTRSIFTKRRHRSPVSSFDHLEDAKDSTLAKSQSQRNKGGLQNYQGKNVKIRGGTGTDTALAHKSDLQLELSPIIKKKNQKRKRAITLSSDSD